MGTSEGTLLGDDDGCPVGCEGLLVGKLEGRHEGWLVGVADEGRNVGLDEGFVGCVDGCDDGLQLGRLEGCEVGA